MAEITRTMCLHLLLYKYQRVGEPDAVFIIHNIREYQFDRGAMNKDCKHVVRKKHLI